MNVVTYLAFVDEMEKIALLTNVGSRIVSTAKSAPRVMKSIPGHVQGGIRNVGQTISSMATPIESLKKGYKATVTDFGTMGKGQKALMGAGLLASAHEALAKTDPMGKGRSRVERGITAVGDQLGGLIGAPFGISGGIAGGLIGRKAGSLVGKGVDLARGYRPQVVSQTPVGG